MIFLIPTWDSERYLMSSTAAADIQILFRLKLVLSKFMKRSRLHGQTWPHLFQRLTQETVGACRAETQNFHIT